MKGSIRQRSPGTWELTIDAGRDPLGKRRRKYVTARGSTKAQAQRKLRELLSSMDRGIHISTEKILLRDWLNPAQLTRADQVARRQVRSPESDSPKPAPLPRLRHASERTEPRGRQQAARPRQRLDHVRHLRTLAPRLAETSRRRLRGSDECRQRRQPPTIPIDPFGR